MFVILRFVKFENPKDFSSHVEFQEFMTIKSGEEAVIGRSRSCSTRIPDDFSSSAHAKFEFTGKKLYIKDLKSKNGTKVNGIKIEANTELYIKDIVVVGTTFIHIDEDRSSSEAIRNLVRPDDGSIDARVLREYQDVTATDTIDKS